MSLAAEEEGSAGGFALARFLPYRLSVVTNKVSRAFARRYSEEFGLSIPEWRVLAVLGAFAPLSSNGICERTAMDKAKVSRAVSLLVGKGLVERAPEPADRRLVRLRHSTAGARVYRAIVPRAQALEAEITADLTAEERALLERLLAKLEARV